MKEIVKKWYVKNATLCFAGGYSAEVYFKHYGKANEKIVLHPFSSLYNADILKETITLEEKKQKKKELGLKENTTILAIGQFIKRKGFDLILEAWKNFDKEYQLVIIGGGDEKNKYETIISENNFKNVRIVDYLPKDEVKQYYWAADVFVMPTREDVWGLVINEAMAAGLPIVSTNRCNSALELVEEGRNGYIVPVDNSNAMSDAIHKIVKMNDKEREIMGKRSLEKISEYTIEKIVSEHKKQMERVLE